MFPIALDLCKLKIALVGEGEAFIKRQKQLHEMEANYLNLFTYASIDEKIITEHNILMVVGLGNKESELLANMARKNNILVNVEDKPEYCDFYFTSFIKRGDLMIAVSTNGASPTLAQEVKRYLGNIFHSGWNDIVKEIKHKRLDWRTGGASNQEIGEMTKDLIKQRKWL